MTETIESRVWNTVKALLSPGVLFIFRGLGGGLNREGVYQRGAYFFQD